MAMILGMIVRAIQLVVYAVFGVVICTIMGVTLDYRTVMRLVAVTMTPVLVLGTVLFLAGIVILPGELLFFGVQMAFFAIHMGLLAYAIRSNRPEEGCVFRVC